MALYDNKHYLLSHIRNSFISSDDSGMCEVVMTCDNVARQIPVGKYDCYPSVVEDEEEDAILAQSFDLNSDLQFGLRRPKARMERAVSAEKKKTAKLKNVKWATPVRPLSNDEVNVFFPHKDVDEARVKNVEKRVSLLTELLEKYPNQPENPFKDYAKLDGNAQVGVPIKKYRIYVTMLSPEIQKFPMEVTIVATAKVSDLIGLICWKCSTEFADVSLKDSVSNYSLYIAEDDGDVDWDFPCLDSREVISKFGFSYLAIVDRDSVANYQDESYPLVIETPQQMSEPSSGHARARAQLEEDLRKFRGQMNALEAPLFQSFSIHILNKIRVRSEIYLEISGERLEIIPVIQPHLSSARMVGVKLWGRQQAETYPMEDVVACELTEHKSNHRSTFKLVHWRAKRDRNSEETGKFKTKDFESDTSVAIEIVNKVNHILECRHSSRRQEYITLRERKSHRRKSFLSPR